MDELPAEIRGQYEREADEGHRITEGLAQLELLRTQEILRRHLGAGHLRIIDVGGAMGIHAAWLAEDGHDVHVVDLMPRWCWGLSTTSPSGTTAYAPLARPCE